MKDNTPLVKESRKRAQHLVGLEPITSCLRGRCSNAAPQPQPSHNVLVDFTPLVTRVVGEAGKKNDR